MRIAVVGGAGFVGVHLVEALLRRGHSVLVYDNLFSGRAKADLPWLHTAELIEGDIVDADAIRQAMVRFSPDVVFHLAAIHYIPYCDQHPSETLRVNVEGTLNVLLAAAAAGAKGIGFASSVAVYPPTAATHRETDARGPCDIYGLTKALSEDVVSHYANLHGMAHMNFRFSNVYGPLETNPHVIPVILDQLLDGACSLRLGRTDTFRDFIYVTDLAEAVAQSVPRLLDPKCREIVNVAPGAEASIQEVVDILCELSGRAIEIVREEQRVRPLDRKHLRADITRLRQLLSWSPTYDLRAGLTEYFRKEERRRASRALAAGAHA